jgi:thiol-disulfide isomerase/thioredoxin
MKSRVLVLAMVACTCAAPAVGAQERIVLVDLQYGARGTDKTQPAPNFSPAGTRVPLADVPTGAALPPGATLPARAGIIKVGPGAESWVKVLATSDAAHPKDLCRVYIDRNRNGNFADDGEALTAKPAAREKTGDVWCSFPPAELLIPYGRGADAAAENYQIDIWIVRQGDVLPDLLRYSVRSWRAGTVTIDGVEALVAVFDMNNDAVFDKSDEWAAIEASAPDAPRQVLSHTEARPTNRMMFVKARDTETVLEFRSITPDGRSMTFAVVDRPVTRAQDRAADDALRDERPRPRATTPFSWETNLGAALAKAKAAGKNVLLDFWTDWCGPCRTMDQWIWTDAEVVATLTAGYVGVKLDGDVEKAIVKKYNVAGYPTVIVVDASGNVIRSGGYMGSKEALAFLKSLLLPDVRGAAFVFHFAPFWTSLPASSSAPTPYTSVESNVAEPGSAPICCTQPSAPSPCTARTMASQPRRTLDS